MNRQQKESVVELLHTNFVTHKGAFFVDYCGLTVVEMQQLRKQLREKGGTLKVAKMRLVRKALSGVIGAESLASYCKNQVGVVFARDDEEAPGIAKILGDFSKKNQSLSLVVGYMDSELLDASAVIRIASLPSKEVLLARLCGALKAPLSQLLVILEEVKKQKQEA
jgi:large subunit ribosomal protein L10